MPPFLTPMPAAGIDHNDNAKNSSLSFFCRVKLYLDMLLLIRKLPCTF